MKEFEVLAETISDIKYYDKKSVAVLIETYFNIWKSVEVENELKNNTLIIKRNYLLSELQKIQLDCFSIENQLLKAKSKLKEGCVVDTIWMANAKYAKRMKGMKAVILRNKITNLNTIQREKDKKDNVINDNVNDIFRRKSKDKIISLIGKEESVLLFNIWDLEIRTEINKAKEVNNG